MLNPDEWTLLVSNSGAEDAKLYYHLYCQHCKEAPRGSTGKMGDDQQKNIDSLIANWDMLKLKDAYLDYTGCFLPWDPDVIEISIFQLEHVPTGNQTVDALLLIITHFPCHLLEHLWDQHFLAVLAIQMIV